MKQTFSKTFTLLGTSASALCVMAAAASADQVFLDDLIVDGSACVGMDCANGENFGFDTLRLKENNLRIHFDDTSSTGSFPYNDWRIVANDSSNGGGNYLAIEDATASRQVFRVDAGAPANSLRVDSAGDVGIGTSNPVMELHMVDGDTATIRLEQDGSVGFNPQTFDIAANEANFFVRDVTNGSTLPFKIQPGAGTNLLYLASDEQIGVNTQSPDAGLHVANGSMLVESGDTNTAAAEMFEVRGGNALLDGGNLLVNNGGNIQVNNNAPVNVTLDHTGDSSAAFRIQVFNEARFSFVGSGAIELKLTESGDLTASGSMYANSFVAAGTTLNVPDYVFADDYDLMPLSEVAAFIDANSHLPKIPSAAEINAGGLDLTSMQLSLLEKVEELTLYTLAQQEQIAALEQRLEEVTSVQ